MVALVAKYITWIRWVPRKVLPVDGYLVYLVYSSVA